jgi:hypothetical protein
MNKKFVKWFGTVLDNQDATFRLANYISAKQYYLKKGLSLDESCRAAVRKVQEAFWDQEHVGKLIDKTRNHLPGIAAPYLTAATEDSRIYLNAGRNFLMEPLEHMRILMGAAVLGGAVYQMKSMFGEDDANLTKGQRAFRTWMVPLPFMDPVAKARQFMDLTQWFFPARLAAGNPNDPLWRRVIANLMLMPLEGGTVEPEIRGLLEGSGFISPTKPKRPPLEGERNVMFMLDKIWQAGALPKLPYNAYQAAKKMQPTVDPGTGMEVFPARQSLDTSLSQMVVPLQVGQPDSSAANIEIKKEIDDLKRQINYAPRIGKSHLIPGMVKKIEELQQQLPQSEQEQTQ